MTKTPMAFPEAETRVLIRENELCQDLEVRLVRCWDETQGLTFYQGL